MTSLCRVSVPGVAAFALTGLWPSDTLEQRTRLEPALPVNRHRREESRDADPRSVLPMYTVRDLMSNRVLYVTPGATVQSAMELLRLQQLGLLPVVEDGRVVGLLAGITLYRYCGELPVREAMLPPLSVEADTQE